MIRAFPASALVAVGIAVATSAVHAQTPTRLTPSTAPTSLHQPAPQSTPAGPLRLTPRRAAPSATPSGNASTASAPKGNFSVDTSSRKSIQVEGLSEIDPNSVGSLSVENGGFGEDMWLGTPRFLIESLLPQLPVAIRSPVLRDLQRRLLLSGAVMPPASEENSATPAPSLISTRIAALQNMGAFKDAQTLTALTPKRATDPGLLRLQAQDKLFSNDYGSACQIVDTVGEYLTKPYWQQLLVFCQSLQGDTQGATFGAELLAESRVVEDPAFFELVDRLTTASDAPIASLPNPKPLHLAALRTAQIVIPDDAIVSTTPAVLRTIGVSPNARLETRLEAAERAVEFGAMPATRLAEIYMAEKFHPDELNNALSLAAADRSPRGRALLFQAAQIESLALSRAAVLAKALEIATEENRYLHVIDIYHTPLANLAASSEMAWFAPEAARALYALDRPLPARNWLAELRNASARNTQLAFAIAGVWLIGLLTDSSGTDENFEANLLAWIQHHKISDKKGWTTKAAAGLRLLETIGYVVPDEAWWQVLDGPGLAETQRKRPGLGTAIIRAAEGGRRAETVMLILLRLGETGPDISDVDAVADAVIALRTVGLENEAKRLVLELAATAGL